ncbi:MAG: hypothetical protein Q9182_005782 [Xanthomendoza sp. 2 TL-2023]
MSVTTAAPRPRPDSRLLNLFANPKKVNKLKAELQKRQDYRKNKAAALASTASPAKPADPAPAPAPAPAPEPAPAPAPAPAPEPEPAPAPQPPIDNSPAQAESTSSGDKKAWTNAENIALVQLIRSGKTFAEVAIILGPRSEAEVEARYKEIELLAVGLLAVNVAGPSAPAAQPAKPTEAQDGKGQQNDKQRNEGKKRGPGNDNQSRQDRKPAGAVASANDPPSDPFTDAAGAAAAEPDKKNEAYITSKVDMKVKGVLKRSLNGGYALGSQNMQNKGVPAGATKFEGRPIIYLEEGDPLDTNDLLTLYQMYMGIEEERWLRMASRIFDITGKRIEIEWLKEKFLHIRP